MLNILGWLLCGLIVGALARLFMPGEQPIGMLGTMVVGIIGALIGGGISYMIWGVEGEPFAAHAWPGYILSIIGAMILLWAAGTTARRTT